MAERPRAMCGINSGALSSPSTDTTLADRDAGTSGARLGTRICSPPCESRYSPRETPSPDSIAPTGFETRTEKPDTSVGRNPTLPSHFSTAETVAALGPNRRANCDGVNHR